MWNSVYSLYGYFSLLPLHAGYEPRPGDRDEYISNSKRCSMVKKDDILPDTESPIESLKSTFEVAFLYASVGDFSSGILSSFSLEHGKR